MNCPACQHENRDGAKFCEECAAPLKRACSRCGADLRPSAKFCDECAAPVSGRPAPDPQATRGETGTRKVVSIIFADLAGSTALHERLDAESARLFMEGYYRAMRGAVERQGGKVAKLLGDGVMAVFGLPLVAEDDAIRAVRAAVDMQLVFRELAERHSNLVGKVGLRVAVNTGEVVAKDETELIGDPVNVAARLQDQARDGDVVIGESTRRLVSALITLEPLGSLALKGRAEAVSAYRVVSLERPASATTAAFVGRDDELARLMTVHETAIRTPAARLTVLLGSPGLGKSRLIGEFVRRAGEDASVITGHCDTAGGTSFAPVTQALRRFLGIDDGATADAMRATVDAAVSGNDSDRARIVDGITALLGGSPASPEETFFVVRRLLAALATTRPVVLVIDDLHWAEPLLLDLVEHLVQWGAGVPLFVLVGARPELRDTRSSLTATGGLVADVVTLAGLDAGAAMRLAANMIGAVDLPTAIAAKVLASSEGNPLFVGELVRMLVHEGALKREGDRWTVGVALAALEMPPTIHALLAARIERLRPEDRAVLERAAVVGRHFSRSAVSALLPRDVHDIDARLESLRRSELIEPDSGWFLGEPVLRFHHLLIRDAAYRRLLKGTRAELHGRLAEWIEAKTGDAVEYDETIGWHLEQAYLHLRELGPLDERSRATGEKAASHLAAAGRRSLARDDLSLAAGLLGRALPCLEPTDASRDELVLDWCEALLAAGDVATATSAIDELDRLAVDSRRLRAWHTCFSGQLTALTAPQSLQETAAAVAAAAAELTALGDDAGEAKAHAVHAQALARLGRVGACEAALDRALAAARKAGDRRRANAVLAGAPVAALWGPSPVTRASGRCLDVVRVLRITQGAPAVEAVALSCQGVLEALRGRTDAARRMIALSRRMVEELGISHRLYEADVFAGRIELLEGDADAAERCLRTSYEGLRELGLGIDAARAAALLARALLALGRVDEAEALSQESELLAGDDLQAAIAWRGVRAEALAQRGEHAAAVELAQASVAIAAATDALLDHADARLALAAALRASGHVSEADAEEKRAVELWQAKGATLLADRARSSAATTTATTVDPDTRADQTSPSKPVPQRPARRPVRPNAATRNADRFAAAFDANDMGAAADLYAADVVNVHHVTGIRFDKAAMVESWKSSGVGFNPSCSVEALASFGDTLCLARQSVRLDGITREDSTSIGPVELELLFVIEVNANGLRRRNELFAVEHLGDAIARLYELRAETLPGGAERECAATTARSVRLTLAETHDLASFAATLAPDLAYEDHRYTGAGRLVGAPAVLENLHAFEQLTSGMVWRYDRILHVGEFSLAVRGINTGKDTRGGGDFERRFAFLWNFGTDGLLTHMEVFEPEDTARVLARLDELAPDESISRACIQPITPYENMASHAWRRMLERWFTNAGQAAQSHLGHEFRYSDRRRLSQVELDAEEFLRFNRELAEMPSKRLEASLLATRGERFCLLRIRLEVEGEDVGPSEIVHLNVVEVNASGAPVALIRFDLDDMEAASAELESRFQAEEAVTHPCASTTLGRYARARESRDWEALAAQFHPEMVTNDHRTLGWGTLPGSDAFVRTQRTLVDLAPDTRHRSHHVRTSEHGYLAGLVISGTRDGGSFELPSNTVMEIDLQGLICRVDIYESEDHERAFARFRSIDGAAESDPPAALHEPNSGHPTTAPNAATQTHAKLVKTHAARDWDGIRRLVSEDFHFEDRGKRVLVDGDVETWLKSMQFVSSQPGVRFDSEYLATLGDRILLQRLSWIGESPEAEFLTDKLRLIEVAADGRMRRVILFDLDDRPAAFSEALFAAAEAEGSDGAASYATLACALLRFDWSATREMLSPQLVFDDRRPLSFGILNRDQWIVSLRVQSDMAPDLASEVTRVLAWNRHGFVGSLRIHGNLRDGGPFENVFLCVFLASGGKLVHVEPHPIDAVEEAVARFEELSAGLDGRMLPGSIGFAPNSAAKAGTRFFEVLAREGDDGAAALVSPDFRYFDRGRRALLEGDVRTWIRSIRFMLSKSRARFEVLSTIGDRIQINRITWTGRADGPELELDRISLLETDDAGRLWRVVLFDPQDRIKAMWEGRERFAAGEAAGADGPKTYDAFGRAVRRRDWEAASEYLSPSLRFEDHRPLSLGVLDGEQWLKSIRVLMDLAPDYGSDVLQVLAWNNKGYLLSLRFYGTLQGGGPFENVLLSIFLASGGKLTHVEPYPVEAHAEALARFEELTRDPFPIAPNSATSVAQRTFDDYAAGNWQVFRELARADFFYEDRSRRALVNGDVETWIASMQFVREQLSGRPEHELVATFGERIELRRLLFVGDADGARVELERLRLTEVDEQGLLRTILFFDPEDRAAACLEGFRRFTASTSACKTAEGKPAADCLEALQRHDWEALRGVLSDDFVLDDHRPLSFGAIDREQWIASLVVQVEMAPDFAAEPLHVLAWNRHGLVILTRTYGTLQGGGPFENVMPGIYMTTGERIVRAEPFAAGESAKAVARFQELCAALDAQVA